jgi:hypothetical protein
VTAEIKATLTCKKHPTYKAVRELKMTKGCYGCWVIWRAVQAVATAERWQHDPPR